MRRNCHRHAQHDTQAQFRKKKLQAKKPVSYEYLPIAESLPTLLSILHELTINKLYLTEAQMSDG